MTLANDPTGNTDSNTWTDIWAGSDIGSAFDSTTSGEVDVTSSVQAALSSGSWYAGVKPVETGNHVTSWSPGGSGSTELEITYGGTFVQGMTGQIVVAD